MPLPAAAAPIDLRSDLLSRPSPAVIDAIVGQLGAPAAFELREDPSQRALEARVADLLGHEDALLFPTCSMANQTALLLLARPGERVIAPSAVHIVTSEAGAPAALAGVTVVELPGVMPDPSEWAEAAAAAATADALRSPIVAFVLENTHNRAGGVPLTTAYVEAVVAVAIEHGLRTHLDGARLLNAAAALNVNLRDLAAPFDSVSLSLNKGLGAPFGAILAGSQTLIEQALAVRQRLGGGIRPTGFLAAGALAALDDLGHIAEDHRRARRLADGLAAHGGAGRPPTNIVLLRLEPPLEPRAFCATLAEEGVLALPFGRHAVRFVTYRGISDADVDRAIVAVAAAARRLSSRADHHQQRVSS